MKYNTRPQEAELPAGAMSDRQAFFKLCRAAAAAVRDGHSSWYSLGDLSNEITDLIIALRIEPISAFMSITHTHFIESRSVLIFLSKSTAFVKACLVPISKWCITSIGAPLSASHRGPGRIDQDPCWAYGCQDDFPTIPPNIACCFLVHRRFP